MAPLRAKRFSSALAPLVLEFAKRQGLDTTALERRYLKERTPAGAEVSLPELASLLEDVTRGIKDPLFGLHCALAMPRGGYGLLEFALRSAPTGRVALEQLAHYGVLINPLVHWSLEVDADEVALHHRAPRKGGVSPQANVFTVARILQISREMLGPDLKPTRVWFAHPAKACPAELAAFLGTSAVAFGRASNGLAFLARDLEGRPAGADPELNRALELHGASVLERCGALVDDLSERTRRAVADLLPTGQASLATTAKRLHVSTRTLQRRLREEGLAFKTLVNEVRRDRAERLLRRTDTPVNDVARELGFLDTGAFIRAFRGWTGTTPGTYRAREVG